jgi:hypothetical protein
MRSPTILKIILVTAMYFSCSKPEDENNNCIISVNTISGNWTWEKFEILDNGTFVDIYSSFELCQRDDYFSFLSNKTYTRVDAGQQCTPPILESGTWDYRNNSFYIDNQAAEVLNYDCQRLTVKTTKAGITYRITYKRY